MRSLSPLLVAVVAIAVICIINVSPSVAQSASSESAVPVAEVEATPTTAAPAVAPATATPATASPYKVSIEISTHNTKDINSNGKDTDNGNGNDKDENAGRRQGLVVAPNSYYATYDATELAALYGIGVNSGAVVRPADVTQSSEGSEGSATPASSAPSPSSARDLIDEAKKRNEAAKAAAAAAAVAAAAADEAAKREADAAIAIAKHRQEDEAEAKKERETDEQSHKEAASLAVPQQQAAVAAPEYSISPDMSKEKKQQVAQEMLQRYAHTVRDMNVFNVREFVVQMKPFLLFLRCDCYRDYEFVAMFPDIIKLMQDKGLSNRFLFLTVGPDQAAFWRLNQVFQLDQHQDVLVGASQGSNIKTVSVSFGNDAVYDSISLQIVNECCGDKFIVRTNSLTSTGFHIQVERIENTGDAGWGQPLVVRWKGSPLAAPRTPALVIDNLPMGANNEKFIFSLSNLPPSYSGPSTHTSNGVTVRNNNRAHTPDDVIAFLQSFIDNTAPLLVRSAAVPIDQPKPNPGDTVDVYGSTFTNVVLDDTKDVLVLVYSPMCGGSQAVLPVVLQAAKQLKDEPNFVVALFDKTANDFSIRGVSVVHYPTLLLFPAGDHKSASYQFLDYDDYNGSKEAHDREVPHSHYSVDNLVSFVRDKGNSGNGAHFHLSGDNVGRIHQRHGGARASSHDHHGHNH